MLVYFILLITNILFAVLFSKVFISNKNKIIYFWITVLQLTLLSGLRGTSTGTDTGAYIIIFDNIANTNTWQGLLDIREEIGFVLINKAVSLIGGTSNIVFLICAFITAFGILKFISDNTDNLYYGVFLLICFMFFFTSMNVVRQYLATAICINSITLLKKKKYISSILLIVVGTLFHKLALLYFAIPLIYIVSKYKFLDIVYYLLLIVFIVCARQIIDFVADLLNYSGYIPVTGKDTGIMNIIVYLGVLLFLIVSALLNKNLYTKYKFDILIFSVVLSLVVVAKIYFSWANRVAWLFSPVVTILIPNIITEYKTKTDRMILYCGISILMFLYFGYCLSINWQGIVPYTV